MKFPSFIKTTQYKRFEIEPRYYDPVKEEIEERISRIKKEMKNNEADAAEYSPTRITFERKSSTAPPTSFLTLIIAAALGGLLVGWLYFGNLVFYSLCGVVPFYLYFRLRKPTRKN